MDIARRVRSGGSDCTAGCSRCSFSYSSHSHRERDTLRHTQQDRTSPEPNQAGNAACETMLAAANCGALIAQYEARSARCVMRVMARPQKKARSALDAGLALAVFAFPRLLSRSRVLGVRNAEWVCLDSELRSGDARFAYGSPSPTHYRSYTSKLRVLSFYHVVSRSAVDGAVYSCLFIPQPPATFLAECVRVLFGVYQQLRARAGRTHAH